VIDPKVLAASTLQLLQADPSRYRNFGVYWYFIKAVLKAYYTKDNLFLLGDYVDKTVTDRLPPGQSLEEALNDAVREYQLNATYNLGRSTCTDADGEEFILIDQDAGGL
jgi:hypothetical protein